MKIFLKNISMYVIIITALHGNHIYGKPSYGKNIKNSLYNMCIGYVLLLSSTIAHECGHALVNSVLTKEPFHINIGGDIDRKTLFSCKYFSIKGFNPLIGYILPDHDPNPRIEILIVLAGPLIGLLYDYLVFKKIAHSNFFLFLVNCQCFSLNATQLLPIYEESSLFHPLGKGSNPRSDGAHVWENFKLLYSQWKSSK